MIKPGSILLGGTFDTELNTRETHIERKEQLEQPRRRIFKYNYPVFNPKSPSYAGNECNLIHAQFGYLVRTNSFRSGCILAHSKSKTKTCPESLANDFLWEPKGKDFESFESDLTLGIAQAQSAFTSVVPQSQTSPGSRIPFPHCEFTT